MKNIYQIWGMIDEECEETIGCECHDRAYLESIIVRIKQDKSNELLQEYCPDTDISRFTSIKIKPAY